MANRIPDAVIEAVREKIDIVDVIGDYVELTQAGRNYKGLCPFHTENTPSFNVNPEGQFYHCFGCQAGGDVFQFVMAMEGLDFPEAVRRLGQRVGIEVGLRPLTPEERERARQRRRLGQIHDIARRFFAEALFIPEAAVARAYLRERGINRPMIDLFGLGYSLPGWETLYKVLLEQGFTHEECIASGLVINSSKGSGAYDRFRGRLMFTICDEQGRPLGFGGRVLDDSQPKYLNSPETPLFQKSTILYGLHLAKEEIRRTGKVIVVEGYTDVIGLYQHGITNVVASLGTAFTEEQARLLQKHCSEVIVAFDGDAAGRAATWRGMDLLAQIGLSVRVVSIPGGEDPDSFVRSRGTEAAKELFARAEPLIEYKLRSTLLSADPRTTQGKLNIVERVVPILSEIEGIVARSEYIRLVATELAVAPQVLEAEVRRYEEKTGKVSRTRNNTTRLRNDRTRTASAGDPSDFQPLEDSLLWLEKVVLHGVIENPSWFHQVKAQLGEEGFQDPLHRRLWREISHLAEAGKLGRFPNTIKRAQSGVLAALVDELRESAPRLIQGQSYDACLRRLVEFKLRRDVIDLGAKARALGNEGNHPSEAISTLKVLLIRFKELKEEIDRVCIY
ncbi:MAG: DNA primase [Firmicutes bacterium]|nr:DNA primase [Bacillota bacterium]